MDAASSSLPVAWRQGGYPRGDWSGDRLAARNHLHRHLHAAVLCTI